MSMTPPEMDSFFQALSRVAPAEDVFGVAHGIRQRKAMLRWFMNQLPKDLTRAVVFTFTVPREPRSYLTMLEEQVGPANAPRARIYYLEAADIIEVIARLTPAEDDDKILSRDEGVRLAAILGEPWLRVKLDSKLTE